jgi:hypothetical protein
MIPPRAFLQIQHFGHRDGTTGAEYVAALDLDGALVGFGAFGAGLGEFVLFYGFKQLL